MAFMVVYYRPLRRECCGMLILNLTCYTARSSGVFRAVLTLPGIAGVILTIGVGVDSERSDFRAHPGEEVRESKGPRICRGYRI